MRKMVLAALAATIATPALAVVDFNFATVPSSGQSITGRIRYDETAAPLFSGDVFGPVRIDLTIDGTTSSYTNGIVNVLDRDGANNGDQLNFSPFEPSPINAIFFIDPTGLAITQTAAPTFDQLQRFGTKQLALPGGVQYDFTISSNLSSAAPEPATWAMMIAGFGAIGAAMRRRKVAVRFA